MFIHVHLFITAEFFIIGATITTVVIIIKFVLTAVLIFIKDL